MTSDDRAVWLRPTSLVDSDAPEVVAFARKAAGPEPDPRQRAEALYYAVRDGVTYTPFCDYRSPETYLASAVLAKGGGGLRGQGSAAGPLHRGGAGHHLSLAAEPAPPGDSRRPRRRVGRADDGLILAVLPLIRRVRPEPAPTGERVEGLPTASE
jgi:hypothetical protein